jgi:nucleoside 2-deoxyribosyltransferase
MKSVYIIGSLRNPMIPKIEWRLHCAGFDAFADWYSAGEKADDHWQEYEKGKGHTFAQALDGYSARNVFRYDKSHLDRCHAAVLVLPAGKSGHLELGYFIGTGKPGYILLDKEPDRFDVMYRFATAVVPDVDSLIKELAK